MKILLIVYKKIVYICIAVLFMFFGYIIGYMNSVKGISENYQNSLMYQAPTIEKYINKSLFFVGNMSTEMELSGTVPNMEILKKIQNESSEYYKNYTLFMLLRAIRVEGTTDTIFTAENR
ncbi:hypothetical protein KIH39_14440 [Telmatocola sphagniphila]|uniref:Uncharacterized protein n=1 Tax=Telmatocola sphagniphila TaxID=1123043 RepID=A0A8E6B1G6_9BACT|nr:hypothetical protein [Telmatocola sphagniphila]QVL30058.1 hypothetical protein KIH39_14440 [Telmatocola sphagniphila]